MSNHDEGCHGHDFDLDKMLSPTQVEILKLLLQQLEYPEIAQRLGMKEETVRGHTFRMREKLEVRTNVGLVKLAMTKNFK